MILKKETKYTITLDSDECALVMSALMITRNNASQLGLPQSESMVIEAVIENLKTLKTSSHDRRIDHKYDSLD